MPVSLLPDFNKNYLYVHHSRSYPNKNVVLIEEAIKRLLEVWKAIHVIRGKVRSDEIFPLYPSDYVASQYVWSVEERGINSHSLWSLPCNQSYFAQQQESVDKDFWTDCIRVRAWFLLWSGKWRKSTRDQSDEWTLQKSPGAWVHRRMDVGGFPETPFPGTWSVLAVEVPSAGGVVERLVAP